MANVRDSQMSISSEAKHENVVIHIDDLSGEEEPTNKNASPSIESDTVDHISRPTVDDNHSSNSSIAQSTTVLDVNDGAGKAMKETANKTYKNLRDKICLVIVITIVCGIVSTPIILFYTRPDFNNPFENAPMQSSCQNVS